MTSVDKTHLLSGHNKRIQNLKLDVGRAVLKCILIINCSAQCVISLCLLLGLNKKKKKIYFIKNSLRKLNNN